MSTPIDNLGLIPGVNLTSSLFTPEETLAAETLIAGWVSARSPSLDLSQGTALYEIMIRQMAQFYLFVRSQVDLYGQTQSLNKIKQNPELASDTIVDAILSNFLISRRSGAAASGRVKVFVSLDAVYELPIGTQFTTDDGLVYVTDQSWTVESSVNTNTNLKLYASDTAESQFYFILPVVAIQPGSQYVIGDNIKMSIANRIPDYIGAITFGSFSGGIDIESTSSLIQRLPDALASRNLISPRAIKIGLAENFSNIISVGVAGMSSQSLHRGGDNIFGIKSGGFADIWVRTGTSLVIKKVELIAQLSADSTTVVPGVNAVYNVTIGNEVYYGHYFVTDIKPSVGREVLGSYVIGNQSKGKVVSPNRLKTNDVAAYSMYGTTNVSFTVPLESGQTGWPLALPVLVSIAGQEGISEIQSYISDPEIRPACVDYLVRAAIPCFISLSPISVHVRSSTLASAIQAEVFSYVNTLPAGSSLNLDSIVHRIRQIQDVIRVEMPLRASGRIFAPNGEVIDITSSNSLTIPDRGDVQVSPESCAFFLDINSIYVNILMAS